MDSHPHSNDVILGRGKGSYLHIGNYRFHKLVDTHKEKYLNSPKTEKTKISRSIVTAIRSQDPPGRFIEYNATSGKWVEVDDKRAWEKTGQALRDRKGLKPSTTPKISDKKSASPLPDGGFQRISNIRVISSADTVQSDIPEKTASQINSHFFPSNQESDGIHDPVYHSNRKSESLPCSSQSRTNKWKGEKCIKNNEIMNDVIRPNLCISNSANPQLLCDMQLSQFIPRNSRDPRPGNVNDEDTQFHRALRKLRRKYRLKILDNAAAKSGDNSVPNTNSSEILAQTSGYVVSFPQHKHQQFLTKPSKINLNLLPNNSKKMDLASNENHVFQGTDVAATKATRPKVTLPSIPKMKFVIDFES